MLRKLIEMATVSQNSKIKPLPVNRHMEHLWLVLRQITFQSHTQILAMYLFQHFVSIRSSIAAASVFWSL